MTTVSVPKPPDKRINADKCELRRNFTGCMRREMLCELSWTDFGIFVNAIHLFTLLDSWVILIKENVQILNVCCITFSFVYYVTQTAPSFKWFFFLHLNGHEKYVTEPQNLGDVKRTNKKLRSFDCMRCKY